MRDKEKNEKEFDLIMLRFIDAYLIVYEQINAPVLMEHFGIARAKASSLFKIYRDERPSNMKYEFSIKAYKKGIVFTPEYLKDKSAIRFLDALEITLDKPILFNQQGK
ncbi:hypothetical protein [Vibrio harveyi]